MAAFVVLAPASAQTGTNTCQHRYTVPEFRADAKRIYQQSARIKPHQLYRLNHLRLCAVSYEARQAMNRIQLRQRKARILRRLRAERECGTAACNRRLGRYMAIRRYGTVAAFDCIDAIVMGESAWRHRINYGGYEGPYQGRAYGIPQALPGSKMSSAGNDWETNPATQIRWMFSYVDSVYGGPCQALSVKRSRGWY